MSSPKSSAKNDKKSVIDDGCWWGKYNLAEAVGGYFAIGPLDLALHHAEQEWFVAQASNLDPFSERLAVQVPGSPPESLLGAERRRYSFATADTEFRVMPMTADRPVSLRPESPVFVPPGEAVTFYVTTPVWVSVQVGKKKVVIEDIPTLPMADSWFGTPIAGELCYASRTWAKNRREAVPSRPHRVITPVEIQNEAMNTLQVEVLKLPLPNLSIFVDDNQSLFTPSVRLTREDVDDRATLRVVKTTEQSGQLVSPARAPLRQKIGFQAFTHLFEKV